MKFLLLLFLFILQLVSFGQNKFSPFRVRLETSIGHIRSKSNNPKIDHFNAEEYNAMQYDAQLSMIYNIKIFNFGIGGGLVNRPYFYNSGFKNFFNKFFFITEVANGTRKTLFSLVLKFGIMEVLTTTYLPYFSSGLSINFGKKTVHSTFHCRGQSKFLLTKTLNVLAGFNQVMDGLLSQFLILFILVLFLIC